MNMKRRIWMIMRKMHDYKEYDEAQKQQNTTDSYFEDALVD